MLSDLALSILVHDMNDSTSAEAYCTLGGEVVPAKTAQQIGERSGLQPWAALVTPLAAPGKQPKPGAVPMKRQKTVDEDVKKDLVMILLEVYMSGGCVRILRYRCWWPGLTRAQLRIGRAPPTAPRSCSTRRP